MRKWWSFVALLPAIFVIADCTNPTPNTSTKLDETPSLVWPDEPEIARIKYIRQFSNAEDLGLRTSFSRSLKDALLGNDDRAMSRPYAIAVNSSKIAVADPGSSIVHIFDIGRKNYYQLKQAGNYDLVSPIGVTLDGTNLYIADSALNKVFALDDRSKLRFTLENLDRPTSLAFDSEHRHLYVADTLAHQVRVFSQNGKSLFNIGKRGEEHTQFNYPSHLAFKNDRLIVNDTMNFRVQIFSADGQVLNSFGKHGVGSGHFTQPKGVTADSQGHIYVADAMSNQVQIFNPDGTFLLGFGQLGDDPGDFHMPTGLAIWDDLIYVADSFNQRIQIFQYLPEER